MIGHFLIPGLIAALAAIVGCSWLCWQLLRQNGRVLLRLEELEDRLDEFDEVQGALPIGSSAPDFNLRSLSAGCKTLADFRGQSLLLIFFGPGCGFCREMVPRLATLGSQNRTPEGEQGPITSAAAEEHPLPLIITRGDVEQNHKLFAEHTAECTVLVQDKMEVAAAYGTKVTPSGYLIDREGRIASELVKGASKLLSLADGNGKLQPRMDRGPSSHTGSAVTTSDELKLLNRSSNRSLARSKIKRDGLKAGTPAPDFRLPHLDGSRELALSELRGRLVLIAFSSPGCGPCSALAPKLEKFHRKRPDVEMIMISKGDPVENQAKVKEHGLSFPVLLQQGWQISRRYAIFATPVAYLIDQKGVIAHDVAVGVDNIEDLLADIPRMKEQTVP
jgi:peroxiredoxin